MVNDMAKASYACQGASWEQPAGSKSYYPAPPVGSLRVGRATAAGKNRFTNVASWQANSRRKRNKLSNYMSG